MVLNVPDTMRFFYFQTRLILFLVLCDVKVLQCANKEELALDLRYGRVVSSTVTGARSQITLLDGPSASSGQEQCNGQALVRLDFSGPYKKAKIELFYGGQPRLWTATIADSPKSYGFGSNHRYSSNCAEAQVFNSQLRLYSNVLPGHLRNSIDGYSLMEVNDDAVNRGANLTIELADETVSWKIHFLPNTSEVPVRRGSIRNNPFLFTLSGQTPSYGPPQDSFVYAGFNRVPLGSFHNGSGLCRVRITFKRELEDSHCARHDCHKYAKCRPTKHSYKCVCKPGYQGNGKRCKEFDICSAKNGGCQHRCHNVGGRFWCSCNEGHKLHPNMRECIAKNEMGSISKRIRVRVTQGLPCKFKKIKDQFLERLQMKLKSQEVCNFPCTIYKPSLRCRAKKNEKLVFANFEIKLDPRDIYASKFCNATCTRCQMEERLDKFITVLRTMTDTERLNVSLDGHVITFREKSLRVSRVTDHCTEKPRRKLKRLAARCRPGQYFDIFLRKCANCSRGSYQPNKSETFCFRCPANKTTLMSGAQDISDCQETRCGGNLTSMSGVITSPNYPDPYPHGIECVWHIHCPKDRGLLMLIPKITIPLTMDCSDHLIMRENGSLSSRLTYYACESYENPMAFISRSKNLYIKFRSKSSNDIVEGFKIFFVTFEEKYRELVRSIVEDGALYANDSLRTILKDENLITQILDIMVHPRKFFHVERSAKNKIPEFYTFVESKVEDLMNIRP